MTRTARPVSAPKLPNYSNSTVSLPAIRGSVSALDHRRSSSPQSRNASAEDVPESLYVVARRQTSSRSPKLVDASKRINSFKMGLPKYNVDIFLPATPSNHNLKDHAGFSSDYKFSAVSETSKRINMFKFGLPSRRRDPFLIDDAVPIPDEEICVEPYIFANKLDTSDLVISIEHCCSCSSHNLSTRHVERRYIENADHFLLDFIEYLHGGGLNARVGAMRVPIDSDKRIGAFEVMVSYKSPHNDTVVREILHSKLATKLWPSYTSMIKNLRLFLERNKVPLCDPTRPFVSSESIETVSYPVGIVPWKMTVVANTVNWSCPSGANSIYWVFDSRQKHISHLCYKVRCII